MTDFLALLAVAGILVGACRLWAWLERPRWRRCACGSETCTGCGRRL